MKLGERIKAARKAVKMTQAELAKKVGLATGTIQQYELGKRQPRYEQIANIADTLGVKAYTLIWGDGEHETAPWVDVLAGQLQQIGSGLLLSKERNAGHIEFPDGYLDVTEEQMKKLSQSLNDFTRYAINDLRKKNPHDFWPKAGDPNAKTPGE